MVTGIFSWARKFAPKNNIRSKRYECGHTTPFRTMPFRRRTLFKVLNIFLFTFYFLFFIFVEVGFMGLPRSF